MIATLESGIIHTPPRTVALKHVEKELGAMRTLDTPGEARGTLLTRACTLTLVVLCDQNEDPASLEELIGQIVESNPARVILIAQNEPDKETGLETRISTYISGRGSTLRIVGEEIALYPRGNEYAALPSAVLALRVSGLPFVLYWRGQLVLDAP